MMLWSELIENSSDCIKVYIAKTLDMAAAVHVTAAANIDFIYIHSAV